MQELGAYEPIAVGYSARPRDVQGSYMPCFLAGQAVATSIAAAYGVPAYAFSHQAGHVKAAAYSCKNTAVAGEKSFFDITESGGRFITFHLSGGTTEALLYDNGKLSILGQTLDLNAGQVVDRVGVMLGMRFPCGEELEAIASKEPTKGIKISVKGMDCNLAGIENLAKKRLQDGQTPQSVAAFALDAIIKTIDKMTENILSQHDGLPILYAGGVASCKRLANHLTKKYNCGFALPELSGDNAAGTALLCRRAYSDGK